MSKTASKFRRIFVAAGTALTMTLAGMGSAHAGKMSLGMTTWVGYGPLFLARDMGYFKEGGLDVDLQVVDDSAIYMAAVAAGKLDGDASTIDEIMKYRSKDVCFKSVYALDDSHGGDGLLAPSSVKSVKDLKGMEVALNEGSTSEFWFTILLKQNGMTLNDVKVVNMTADDAAAAFMADRVPVAVTWEPHLTLAKKANKGQVLIDSSKLPGVIVDVVALNCDYIKKNPKDVAALVNGLYKANEFIKTNQAKAYEIMAKGVGGWLKEPKDFADAAAGVNFYGKARNAEFLKGGDAGEAGKLLKLGSEIYASKLKMPIKYADMVDSSFLAK